MWFFFYYSKHFEWFSILLIDLKEEEKNEEKKIRTFLYDARS